MNVRHLRFFVALSTERHFGRAAAACSVSQPALSMAIRKLESELGVRLIERGGGGMIGLTDAGEALVDRARQTVNSVGGIAAEATRLRGQLNATLRLGTVPTGVAAAPTLVGPLLDAHPGVRVSIRTAPSDVLVGEVLRHELDAALVYDDVRNPALNVQPLYRERFVLVSTADQEKGGAAEVSWRSVGARPLCLLTPEMQHRAILEEALRAADVVVSPRVQADSFALLLGFVRRGWSTVIGHTWLLGEHLPSGTSARPITDPMIEPTIALIVASAGPPAPVVRALIDSLAGTDVDALIETALPGRA
ncbi:LysR family transcriptional regulator [Patulibacter sp. NPDC049589]|uniref:LysR family transcriptional regulator n=1 Tax=Patulibacter sp. NPDC049589 TaxID=3154731 RepID=UPI00343A56E0